MLRSFCRQLKAGLAAAAGECISKKNSTWLATGSLPKYNYRVYVQRRQRRTGEAAAQREAALEELLKVAGLCCCHTNPVFTASSPRINERLKRLFVKRPPPIISPRRLGGARRGAGVAFCKQTNKQLEQLLERVIFRIFPGRLPKQGRCPLICV